MGVLNVTPDSFFDGGQHMTTKAAVNHALEMIRDGADIVDVGGESSRPGAAPVPGEVELSRVVPVITGIRESSDVLISVDTTKSRVARAALAAGADIVNDISALRFDPEMGPLIAEADACVVLMHMQGTPRTMQENPTYSDPVEEIKEFFSARMEAAVRAGIPEERIILDPGIGFGKRLEHNLAILRGIGSFLELGAPVLIGLSRKSFLGELLGLPPAERLVGTVAANAVAVRNGADIIRVHDVKEGRQTADVARRLREDAT
ncbi:MAG TPA: dihydropteroate synthase [Candidatus Acetothermia bacterium]|nr:dihydropteroate synthase [Candidatus Acetothermia bacterium]